MTDALPSPQNQSGASILWTGATGFFGKALLRHFKNQPRQPAQWHLLSRDPAAFRQRWPNLAIQPNVQWHRGDIMSLSDLQMPPLTHVVHAAADSTNALHLTPLDRYDQIVTGTRAVLDLAVRCGARRFLLVSSGGAYGPQPSHLARLPEDYAGIADPLDATTAYSIGKRAAEHLCCLYAHRYGLEVVIARCFAFVGEDLPTNAHFAIGNFIRDALQSEAIVVRGNGKSVRSYLYQTDLVDWLTTLLWRGKPGEAYNVGSDHELSILKLAGLVRDLISPNKPIHVLGDPQMGSPSSRYIPDVTKITTSLNVQQTVSLEQAIRATVSGLLGDSGRP